MTYVKERYAKLLNNVNQTFSYQLSGLESPPEFQETAQIIDHNQTLLTEIKKNLLEPLPVLVPEASINTSSKERISVTDQTETVSLPNLVSLKCRIYDVWERTKLSSTETRNSKVEHLELLFLSQAYCAMQCLLTDKILEDIIPLSENIQAWSRYHGKLGSALYLAESIPKRAYLGFRSLSSFNSFKNFERNTLVLWGASMMRSPAQVLFHRPLKGSRIELHTKREKLRRLKEVNGATLGFICELPDILEACDRDLTKVAPFLLKNIDSLSALLDNLQESPKEGVFLDALVKVEEKDNEPFSNTEVIYTKLLEMVQKLEKHKHVVPKHIDSSGPPGVLSQIFLPSLLSLFTVKNIWRFVWNNQTEILAFALDAKETIFAFFKDWIVSPLQNVIGTIRNKNHQLAIMSKDSLASDLKSLERMALEFAASHQSSSTFDLERERSLIQQGDLSTVLQAYEKAIQSPLSSAVFGDLVQTLLIQVQKAKVDASLALSALDTLLKSNELTFGLIAVIPPLLLSWTFWKYFQNWCLRRTGQSRDHIVHKARLTLSRIFRILNLQLGLAESDNQDRYINQGFLLCETHYLRQLVTSLAIFRYPADSHAFLKLVEDLESFTLSPSQRLNVIQNMLVTYSFLAF